MFFPGKGIDWCVLRTSVYIRQDVMITMFEIFIHTRRVSNREDPVMFPMFFYSGFLKVPLDPLFLLNKNGNICLSVFFTHTHKLCICIFVL